MSNDVFFYGTYQSRNTNYDPEKTADPNEMKWRSRYRVDPDSTLGFLERNDQTFWVMKPSDSEIVFLTDLEYQLRKRGEIDDRKIRYSTEYGAYNYRHGVNPQVTATYNPDTYESSDAINPNQDPFLKAEPFAKPLVDPNFIKFAEVSLNLGYDYGVVGGASFKTEIITVSDDREQRNALHYLPLGRWQLGDRSLLDSDIQQLEEISELKQFQLDRLGSFEGFRFKDWADYRGKNELIAIGDGVKTQFQLRKAYRAGDAVTYRPIQKPVAGTVELSVDGEVETDWTIDYITGVVSHDQPLEDGATLHADFEFDVPVWFEQDKIDIKLEYYDPQTKESLYRLGNVFVVEGRIPLAIDWAINADESITEELDLGIVYETTESLEISNLKLALKSGYIKRESKREDQKLLFNLGSRKYCQSELNTLLGYFWNARGKCHEFPFLNQGDSYIVRFDSDILNIKFEAASHDDALFNLSGLKLQLKQKKLFKLPPFGFTLEPIIINPNDPNDPTISQSNPNGSGGSAGSDSNSSGGSVNSSASFTLSSFVSSGTNLALSQPNIDPNRTYSAICCFWQADSLWILAQGSDQYFNGGNNAGRSRSFLYRGIFNPDGSVSFSVFQDLLYNYGINGFRVVEKQDKTVVVAQASLLGTNEQQNNNYILIESGGLLEIVISNSGSVSADYIAPANNNSPDNNSFETPFFAFENYILLNSSNRGIYENRLVYQGSNFVYINHEWKLDRFYRSGYPLTAGHIEESGRSISVLDIEADSTPGNVYAAYLGVDNSLGVNRFVWQVYSVDKNSIKNELLTIYLRYSYQYPNINQSVQDDGSYSLSIDYYDYEIPENQRSVTRLYARQRNDFNWIEAGFLTLPNNSDATKVVYDNYGADASVLVSELFKTDLYGNGFFYESNKSVFYKSGSNYGILINNQLDNQLPQAVCNSPYGFIVITHPQFSSVFSANTKINIIQTT